MTHRSDHFDPPDSQFGPRSRCPVDRFAGWDERREMTCTDGEIACEGVEPVRLPITHPSSAYTAALQRHGKRSDFLQSFPDRLGPRVTVMFAAEKASKAG